MLDKENTGLHQNILCCTFSVNNNWANVITIDQLDIAYECMSIIYRVQFVNIFTMHGYKELTCW